MSLRIKPYTEALGAEILNINLGRKLSPTNLSLIKDTLNKYHVLFFRDQDISSKQFINYIDKIIEKSGIKHHLFIVFIHI